MLSKAKIKFIKSLQIKKYRKQEQSFIVEGAKSVRELLDSDFELVMLAGTKGFLSTVSAKNPVEVIEVGERELNGLGEFQTNDAALAVARMRPNEFLSVNPDEFALLLDDIRDPGNLGTIIRTADWFGVTKIIASPETADFYNPKVISATMGSFTRIKIFYTGLADYLRSSTHRVYGAYLEGANIRQADFGNGGLILIGNESKGIHPELETFVTEKVTIPKSGKAESLNAGIATGIFLFHATR
jgi:RNA methyltransferase, TrmH family